MRAADWIVLVGALAYVVIFGLWRGRASNSVNKYLLAGRSMPWHVVGLSIMATQASAVTFISTTGQSYVDGMRFVQFYFGLPIAMVHPRVHGRAALPPRRSLHGVRVPRAALRFARRARS